MRSRQGPPPPTNYLRTIPFEHLEFDVDENDLPHFSIEQYEQIKEEQQKRQIHLGGVGVSATLITPPEPGGERKVVLLDHKKTSRVNPPATLGLMNETARENGRLESPTEIITRAFHEEPGIDLLADQTDISLSKWNPWQYVAYPLRHKNNNGDDLHALIMCIRIFLGEKTMDRLASFEETEEIKSAKVLRINDVLQQPERLREGVAASLRYIQDEGLLNVAPGNLRPFEPSPVMYVGKDTIPHA